MLVALEVLRQDGAVAHVGERVLALAAQQLAAVGLGQVDVRRVGHGWVRPVAGAVAERRLEARVDAVGA